MYDDYGYENVKRDICFDNSIPWLNISDEEYDVLTSQSAKSYFSNMPYTQYCVIEDISYEKENTLSEHIENIKKEFFKEKARLDKLQREREKYAKAKEEAKLKTEKRKIEKAKELLKKAGEL